MGYFEWAYNRDEILLEPELKLEHIFRMRVNTTKIKKYFFIRN